MKNKHKMLSIIGLMAFVSTIMSGCTDSMDINEKTIITTVVFDKENDDIKVDIEIANIEHGNQSDSSTPMASKYINVKSQGKTIEETRYNLDRHLEKKPYLSAIRTLILTEDFAVEHLVEYMYRVRALESYRKKIVTVITKDEPDELFENVREQELSLGFIIEDLLRTLDKAGETFTISTSQILEELSTEYAGFLMPVIGLQYDEVSLTGYSVVFDDTVIGYIPAEESKGILYLKADRPKSTFVVPYQEHNLTVDTELIKRRISSSYQNNAINYNIKLEFEVILLYGDQKTPYNFKDKDFAAITEDLSVILKNEVVTAIDQAQKQYQCDYLHFDDYFRVKYPAEYEKMDWEKQFIEANYNVEVKVELSGSWMLDYTTDKTR